MSRLLDLIAQVESLLADIKAEARPRITTAAELTQACATGGSVALADGIYSGNFTITKPLTLVGGEHAILTPIDKLVPTLVIDACDVTVRGCTVQNGLPDRECLVVGRLSATSVAQQPARVLLEDVTVVAGASGGHRGIALHGVDLTVRKCRVLNFWEAGRDSQAIWINNGPGPYTIDQCYLEASGETLLTGGDRIAIPNCVPSDIVITNNVLYKPDVWKTTGATVKNAIELKIGRRVRIEGNTIDGNWASGQVGTPLVFTVRNQYGDTPWAVVDEVTVRGNVTRRCPNGMAVSILAAEDRGASFPSQQTRTMTFERNLFTDSPGGIIVSNGVVDALVIDHNTFPAIKTNLLQFNDSRATVLKSRLTFTNNVAKSGAYGASGTGLAAGVPTLEAYNVLVAFTGNVIEKTPERTINWPAGNTLLAPGELASKLDPGFHFIGGTVGY